MTFKHDYTQPFDLTKPDANGYVPDQSLVGRKYIHITNDKSYVVHSFVWLGESDTWGICHIGSDTGVPFVRSVTNFFERLKPVV